MPNMANITVKDASNADVIYVASSPSSGDKTPARWKQNAAGTSWATRPEFSLVAKSNARGTTRVFTGDFKFPIVDAVTGVVTDVIPGSFTFIGVNRVDSAVLKNAFTQFGNLIATALIRSCVEEGISAT